MNNLSMTEEINPDTQDIDLMSPYEIASLINNEDKKVALAVETQLPEIAKAIDIISNKFLQGGRLAYFGAGTSGRIGFLDASECPPTFGVDADMVRAFIAGGSYALEHAVENAEDCSEKAIDDMKLFNPQKCDVVVGLSASGNPNYVITALKIARETGCATIAITCNPKAFIRQFADVFICPIVGPEVVAGSSRLKAGTAQKMILNMLSTGAMIRIGKTYKNYMVDVNMVNQKLRERGIRIVADIAHIDELKAEFFLKKANNHIKEACVMAIKNCSALQAKNLLKKARGILRKVIYEKV